MDAASSSVIITLFTSYFVFYILYRLYRSITFDVYNGIEIERSSQLLTRVWLSFVTMFYFFLKILPIDIVEPIYSVLLRHLWKIFWPAWFFRWSTCSIWISVRWSISTRERDRSRSDPANTLMSPYQLYSVHDKVPENFNIHFQHLMFHRVIKLLMSWHSLIYVRCIIRSYSKDICVEYKSLNSKDQIKSLPEWRSTNTARIASSGECRIVAASEACKEDYLTFWNFSVYWPRLRPLWMRNG